MEPARISAIIPTRNRCELCRRAARSALDQSISPWEVLVCDDGSTDDTGPTFKRWAEREPRLRYVRIDRDGGTPAASRNAGIEAATGDWIAFLDDDDFWLREKLAFQEPLIGEFDVVAANAVRSDGDAYFPNLHTPVFPGRTQLVLDNPIINSTAVVRRSFIERVGGLRTDRRLAGIEDYCLWLDLVDAGARFLVLPNVLAVYETSAHGRLSDDAVRTQREIARHMFGRLRTRPLDGVVAGAAVFHTSRALKLAARQRLRRRSRSQ